MKKPVMKITEKPYITAAATVLAKEHGKIAVFKNSITHTEKTIGKRVDSLKINEEYPIKNEVYSSDGTSNNDD